MKLDLLIDFVDDWSRGVEDDDDLWWWDTACYDLTTITPANVSWNSWLSVTEVDDDCRRWTQAQPLQRNRLVACLGFYFQHSRAASYL